MVSGLATTKRKLIDYGFYYELIENIFYERWITKISELKFVQPSCHARLIIQPEVFQTPARLGQ